jgi:threonine aldolase
LRFIVERLIPRRSAARVRLPSVCSSAARIAWRSISSSDRGSATVVARAGERGVLVFAFGPRTVRAVTHLDVDRDACRRGAEILAEIAEGPPA